MTIAASVQKHLIREGVSYELIEHTRTLDSTHTAQAAHVPGAQLAKGTVLKDDQGFVIAIVPATRRVDLGAMRKRFGRPLGLAGLPEAAKGPAFAVAAGLLVYPQAAHLEHFEPRRTRQLMTGTGGYMARVGRWLRESF